MKTIHNLLETLKELISEASQNRSDYDKMRLIPIPVNNQDRKFPNQNSNQ